MIRSSIAAAILALSLSSAPGSATSFITDPISNPSDQWAGIDYWGVQVSQFSTVDQLLTFNVTDDSRIDIYMGGSPKFQFTDVLLNGESIASNFTISGANALKASGYAAAGAVSLRFQADYDCVDCWGDWFGGYVQVTKATIPTQPTPAIPEPASWALMLGGMGIVGASMRRRSVSAHPA